MRNYAVEIGLVGTPAPGTEFVTADLGAWPILAFAARGYLAPGTGPLSLEDLARMPLVFREPGSRTHRKIEEEAVRLRITLAPVIEVEGRKAMREVVASGTGIGFVSEAELGDDNRLVRVPMAGPDLRMRETLICLSQRRNVRLIRAFMEFVAGI